MSIKFRSLYSSALAFACIIGAVGSTALYASPSQATSETPVFATNTTLAANLKNLAGKRATLYLKNGTSLAGTIKSVGDHLVHLEKLDGKDFFDALITLEEIAAVDIRARSR